MLSTRDLVFKERLSKKTNKKICEVIHSRESSIKEHSKVETTGLYENSSSGKC